MTAAVLHRPEGAREGREACGPRPLVQMVPPDRGAARTGAQPEPSRAAVYVYRVPGEVEDVDLLVRLAVTRGWDVSLYEDHGFGYADDDRPALDRLRHDCRHGLIAFVFVAGLAQLGPSIAEVIRVAGEFHSHGVGLVAVAEGIDSTTAAGSVAMEVFGAISRLDRPTLLRSVGGIRLRPTPRGTTT